MRLNKKWLLVLLLKLAACTLRVAFIGRKSTGSEFWNGFVVIAVPEINRNGGVKIGGENHSVHVMFYPAKTAQAAEEAVQNATYGMYQNGNAVGKADLVVCSTQGAAVKIAAESVGIPNIHCTGGNPAFWTPKTSRAFGMHVPFTWYTRAPIRIAASRGLKSIAIICSKMQPGPDFRSTSGLAALEWARDAGLNIVGPTVAWCHKYAHYHSCRVVQTLEVERCICGKQADADELHYTDMNIETMNTFYEINDVLVLDGEMYNKFAKKVSQRCAEYFEGIIEDLRSQGEDPEIIVQYVLTYVSLMYSLVKQNMSPKMLLGDFWARSWWPELNGTQVLNQSHFYYIMRGGQWHHELKFKDNLFGDSANFVKMYQESFGKVPHHNAAGCAAVGSILWGSPMYGLTAEKLDTTNIASRRDTVQRALRSTNNPNTIFGMVRFNSVGQNSGRDAAVWQFFKEGNRIRDRVVIPLAYATHTERQFPTWGSRFGCSAGERNAYETASRCEKCPEGKFNGNVTLGYVETECMPCEEGSFSNSTGQTSCSNCEVGSYASHRGQSACRDCSEGFYGPKIGAKLATDCLQCTQGSFNSQSGQSECQLCPTGTYKSVFGKGSCSLCEPGRHNPMNGSGSLCKDCEFGKYADGYGQILCSWCPAGTYGGTKALSLPMSESCARCPPGEHSLFSAELCRPCPLGSDACPGEANATDLNSSLEADIQCADGYHGMMCELCTAGWYRGLDRCLQCSSADISLVVLVVMLAVVACIPFMTSLAVRINSLIGIAIFGKWMSDASLTLSDSSAQYQEMFTNLKEFKTHARSLVLFGQLVGTWVQDRYILFADGRLDKLHDIMNKLGKWARRLGLDINFTSDFNSFLICKCGLTVESAFVANYMKEAFLPLVLVAVLVTSAKVAAAMNVSYDPIGKSKRAAVLIMYVTFAGQVNTALNYLPAKGSNFDCAVPHSADVENYMLNGSTLPNDGFGRPKWARAQAMLSLDQQAGVIHCFEWRWRSNYHIALDSPAYSNMLPLIWIVFLFYCIFLPMGTMWWLFKHRKVLNPQNNWARPWVVHVQNGLVIAPTVTLDAELTSLKQVKKLPCSLEGTLGVAISPVAKSRLSELVTILSRAAIAISDRNRNFVPEDLRSVSIETEDGIMLTCLVGFWGVGAETELCGSVSTWHTTPLDFAVYRDEHFGREVSYLEDFFSSYVPVCFFFELVNLARQLILSSFGKLVSTSGGAYICFSIVVIFAYLMLLVTLRPYPNFRETLMQLALSTSLLLLFLVEITSLSSAHSSLEGYDDSLEKSVFEGLVYAIVIPLALLALGLVASSILPLVSTHFKKLPLCGKCKKTKVEEQNDSPVEKLLWDLFEKIVVIEPEVTDSDDMQQNDLHLWPNCMNHRRGAKECVIESKGCESHAQSTNKQSMSMELERKVTELQGNLLEKSAECEDLKHILLHRDMQCERLERELQELEGTMRKLKHACGLAAIATEVEQGEREGAQRMFR